MKYVAGSVLPILLLALPLNAQTISEETAKPAATNGAVLGEWTMDLEAAKALAKREKLPLLLNFSGSDWCRYCILVDEKVFTTPTWRQYAKDHFVLVTLDFPQDTSRVPEAFRARNQRLQKQFGIEGFPTFVALQPDGETMLGTFRLPGGDLSPLSFMRQTGEMLGKLPEEEARQNKALSKAQRAARAEAHAALTNIQHQLDAWIATSPSPSPENNEKYRAFRMDLEAARAQVERIDLAGLIKRFSAEESEAANAEALAAADRQIGLLEQIAEAKRNVADWLLSRPRDTAEARKTFSALMERLQALQTELNGES